MELARVNSPLNAKVSEEESEQPAAKKLKKLQNAEKILC